MFKPWLLNPRVKLLDLWMNLEPLEGKLETIFLTVKVNSLVASLNPHSGIDDALNLLKSAIIAGSGEYFR